MYADIFAFTDQYTIVTVSCHFTMIQRSLLTMLQCNTAPVWRGDKSAIAYRYFFAMGQQKIVL